MNDLLAWILLYREKEIYQKLIVVAFIVMGLKVIFIRDFYSKVCYHIFYSDYIGLLEKITSLNFVLESKKKGLDWVLAVGQALC